MKKLFVIVFDNQLEFDELADKIGNRFINSDNTIEYCGSWSKIMFNKDECLNAISSTVNHFIMLPEKKEIYFGCDQENLLEIQELLLSESCEIIVVPCADFV